MNHQCRTPGCSRHAPCNACSVVQDGQSIRVPMYMMDSLQRSVAASVRSPAPPMTESQRQVARAEAYQDHCREQHEARQRAIAADPALAAYHAQYQR